MAITVVNAADLTARNQNRLQDYFREVPGLSLNGNGQGRTNLAIRGITTGVLTNPTVGITIDDVPFGSTAAVGYGDQLIPDLDPGDLARVEVLKGPQGTLYGASSLGGLLKYVTVDPSTHEISGRAEADVGSIHDGGTNYSGRGSINLPIVSDRFAIRVSGFDRHDAGFVDNLTTGKEDVNRSNTYGGRVSGLLNVTDNIVWKLGALYQRTHGDGSADINSNADLSPTYGDLNQRKTAGTGQYRQSIQLYTSNLSIDLGFASLASVTGYGINKYSNLEDFPLYAKYASAVFNVSAAALSNYFRTKKFSQELRLTSPSGHLFQWQIGGFYTKENTAALQTIEGIDPQAGTDVGTVAAFSFPSTYREYAGFGDLTVNLTDRFNVQFGGRYSENRQTYKELDNGPLYGDTPGIIPLTTSSSRVFTYLINPQYKFSRDLMVYARVASGYRPGGPNPGSTFGFPATFKADRTTNYEVGLKTTVLDRRLTLDAALYYIDWRNIQVQQTDPVSGFAYFTNAGKARSEGFEASANYTTHDKLSIVGSINVSDAILKRDLPAGSYGLSGDRLPYSSKFTGNIAVDKEFPLNAALDGFVGGTLTYSGKRYGAFASSASDVRAELPAYTTFDLRAGVAYDSWRFSVVGTNLNDARGVLSAAVRRGVPGSPFDVTVVRPRTVSFVVTKSF